MFDHVKFGVGDYAASRAFYLKALGPLGVVAGSEGAPAYGIELCLKGNASLCLFQADEKTAPLHLAFAAGTRQQVDAFHRAALAAGGRDNGAPGLRPQYHANYYAAFVIDPDGHNIEAVCHEARPSLLVRAATPADTPVIADIHTRSRASAYRGMLSDAYLDHQMPAESAQLWQQKAAALAGGAGQAFIAEAAGEPLAFVCVLAPDDERSAYIDNLHALPDRKGGGAGTALLDAAARWARTHGATRMHLRVIDRNEDAIGFYEARGWQCIGQLDDVMGGTPIRARVYALALN